MGREDTERSSGLRNLLRSWWVLLTLLLWLNWTAFAFIGLRAKRRRWLLFAGLYLALSAASIVFLTLDPDDPVDTWREDVGASVGFLGWAASLVHALAVRKDYLERLEVLEHPSLDAAEDRLQRRERALELVREDPHRALDLGIGRPDVEGAFHGELVDVNHAPLEALSRLPGVDDALARRTVAVREEIDGFSSLEDWSHVMSLPPSLVERLRDEVVFLPR